MKLRIKGNSIRMRLDRRDLGQLLDCGHVNDAVKFGPAPGQAFTYAVQIGPAPRGLPQVEYAPGQILVKIDREDVIEWQNSDRVGFDHQQSCDGGTIRVVLEKDFACLDRPAGEEAEDAWAFPNPSPTC